MGRLVWFGVLILICICMYILEFCLVQVLLFGGGSYIPLHGRRRRRRPDSQTLTVHPHHHYIHTQEFLTPEEETALLAFADRDGGRHWATHTHPGMARRVQHYGYAFDYATRGVDFEGLNCAPMPFHGEAAGASGGVFAAVVARVLRAGLLRMAPDQMTLNEYTP